MKPYREAKIKSPYGWVVLHGKEVRSSRADALISWTVDTVRAVVHVHRTMTIHDQPGDPWFSVRLRSFAAARRRYQEILDRHDGIEVVSNGRGGGDL